MYDQKIMTFKCKVRLCPNHSKDKKNVCNHPNPIVTFDGKDSVCETVKDYFGGLEIWNQKMK